MEFIIPRYGRKATFDVVVRDLTKHVSPMILEVGTVQQANVEGDGHSTLMLAYVAAVAGGKLTSIDISLRAVNFSKEMLRKNKLDGPWVEVICAEAVEFMKTWDTELDMLYLDGGGPADATSAESPGVAEHYVDIFMPIEHLIKPGGYVMIDDTLSFAPSWTGKGGIVIPYLLDKGWDPIVYDYTFLLQRPI